MRQLKDLQTLHCLFILQGQPSIKFNFKTVRKANFLSGTKNRLLVPFILSTFSGKVNNKQGRVVQYTVIFGKTFYLLEERHNKKLLINFIIYNWMLIIGFCDF